MKHYLVVKLSPRRWTLARYVDAISGVPVYDVFAADAPVFVNMLDALHAARERERAIKTAALSVATPLGTTPSA